MSEPQTATCPVGVFGGNGATGTAVATALRQRGVDARLLGRRDAAEPVAALAGCRAVYLIAPNMHSDEPAYVEAALRATRAAGIDRVVYHSVASPFAPAMPHHRGKAESEDLVRCGAVAWTVLQPCAYTQSFLGGLETGELRVPFRVTAPFGLVDLADVGEAAATVLLDDSHTGATYELAGPALVSMEDLAAAASHVLGRPVTARRVAPSDWVAISESDLGSSRIARFLAMFAYYDQHGLPAGGLPLAALLGRAPTSIVGVLRRRAGVG